MALSRSTSLEIKNKVDKMANAERGRSTLSQLTMREYVSLPATGLTDPLRVHGRNSLFRQCAGRNGLRAEVMAPAAKKVCLPLLVISVGPSVREDVLFRPAGQIKLRTGGKEVKTGLGDLAAAFSGKPFVQLLTQRMQVEYVRGGVVQLRV